MCKHCIYNIHIYVFISKVNSSNESRNISKFAAEGSCIIFHQLSFIKKTA